MVKDTLLDSHIAAGKILLQELDAREFNITTAMWFYYPDFEEWKLLLFSPQFDEIGQRESYTKISEIITDLGQKVGMISLMAIKLIFKNDPLLKLFKNIIHIEGISTVRMTSNYLNGIYVDDAVIYRNIIAK